MRKQYHFWPGEHSLDAWDVDRLVGLAADIPSDYVDLSDILEIDTAYWFQDNAVRPTVRKVVDHARLMRDAGLSWPIIVGPTVVSWTVCIVSEEPFSRDGRPSARCVSMVFLSPTTGTASSKTCPTTGANPRRPRG